MNRNRLLALLVAISSLSTIATPGTAAAVPEGECGERTTTQAFAPFGDDNAYFRMRGGGFEGNADGWIVSGAAPVNDQAPWRVAGPKDRRALRLTSGAKVTSPAVCVNANEDSVRFFVRPPSAPGARLDVVVQLSTARGSFDLRYTITSGSDSGWTTSPRLALPNVRNLQGEQKINVVFTASGGVWTIDDVMIDPWVSR